MNINKIAESLSPNEVKILPHLDEKEVSSICKKSNVDKISVVRALEYLSNKKIINLSFKKKKIVEIGVNGALYKNKQLPERRLLNVIGEKRILSFEDAQKQASLSNEEFKASIGTLKRKLIIELKNKKIILSANKIEISRKMPEEIFIESLPLDYGTLSQEQLDVLKFLRKRRDIVKVREKKIIDFKVTDLGKQIINLKIKNEDLIEQISPEILKKEKLWKGKKFRRYDVMSPVPEIYGGKRHFVNQALDYARKIWTDMGFKEMTGSLIVSSFWNFDALFTAQDHPVRDMQDTFFISDPSYQGELANKKIVDSVRKAHETGISGSKGWQYKWNEKEAKNLVLRTHTTCLSSQTLAKINPENLPQKFFALGKCFRNETLDWSHGFEFNQTEGIVVDENANFRHLLGYLKQFFKKMGYDKIRFRPAYFPYTEPSVEIDFWHSKKKVWLELGGAGIFRPEVTIPLLGKNIPVLAWGPGADRILMEYYKINDLREFYKNNLTKLRKMKFWIKQ